MKLRLLCLGAILGASSLVANALGNMPTQQDFTDSAKKGSHALVSEAVAASSSEQRCEQVLAHFNQQQLQGKIDVEQLVDIVRTLNDRKTLPTYFITKKEARRLGWQPGRYFNDIPALKGKSIGGDFFGNYEQRLPLGNWREADLDYRGFKRNAKRLVFSENAQQRYVTVDHYQHFYQIPVCQ